MFSVGPHEPSELKVVKGSADCFPMVVYRGKSIPIASLKKVLKDPQCFLSILCISLEKCQVEHNFGGAYSKPNS